MEHEMKQTIGWGQFSEAFARMDRKDQFSYEALELIYDYLTELEDSTGEELELDVIAICCDYTEDSYESIAELYGIELDSDDDAEDQHQQVRNFIETESILVGVTDSGAIVYQQF